MISTHRDELLRSLAETISDYRQHEIDPITVAHVEKWLNQFDVNDQPTILAEMDSIMKRFYFSKVRVKECLRKYLREDVIAAHNPVTLLPHVCFLQVQSEGSSQEAMVQLIDEILLEDYQFSLRQCGIEHIDTYIYVDDGVYTGNRLRYDLTSGANAAAWISNEALPNCTLMIYTIIGHIAGLHYVEPYILNAAKEKGIKILIKKHSLIIDDKRFPGNKVEFLWPEEFSTDPYINSYVSNLRLNLAQRNWPDHNLFRVNGIPKQEKLFSSLVARRTVERAFLKKGVRIVTASQNPSESVRPLGFEKIGSLGFGTLCVTYRNIANNCPLVLWWGEPGMPVTHPLGIWYPLFPRRTNSQRELAVDGVIPGKKPF